MTQPSGPPPIFDVFNEIAIIEHLSRTAAERVFPQGLSMAGFTVLHHMVRMGHDQLPPARIADAIQVTKGAMTGTLKRLEGEGLVQIDPDPRDGRGKLVSVTPAGRAARDAAIAALAPQFAMLTSEVTPAELNAALPVLKKLRAILDRARD